MSQLAHKLGLSSQYRFHDVYSLDEQSLLALVPRSCHAVLFIFPMTPVSADFYNQDEADRPKYNGCGAGPEEPVMWFHQTIRHACGLIGLLHCISNMRIPHALEPSSTLDTLFKEATPLDPERRAQLLYDSSVLEAAHQEAAQEGDSIAPLAEEYDDPHAFTAFVKGSDGHLWELEGRRKGPVDRGQLGPDDDCLSEMALNLGPRAYVKREAEAGSDDVRFSCIALC